MLKQEILLKILLAEWLHRQPLDWNGHNSERQWRRLRSEWSAAGESEGTANVQQRILFISLSVGNVLIRGQWHWQDSVGEGRLRHGVEGEEEGDGGTTRQHCLIGTRRQSRPPLLSTVSRLVVIRGTSGGGEEYQSHWLPEETHSQPIFFSHQNTSLLQRPLTLPLAIQLLTQVHLAVQVHTSTTTLLFHSGTTVTQLCHRQPISFTYQNQIQVIIISIYIYLYLYIYIFIFIYILSD